MAGGSSRILKDWDVWLSGTDTVTSEPLSLLAESPRSDDSPSLGLLVIRPGHHTVAWILVEFRVLSPLPGDKLRHKPQSIGDMGPQERGSQAQ